MQIKISSIKDEQIPPWQYVKQIAKYIPSALFTYIILWELKDNRNKLTLDKSTISNDLPLEKSKFKRELLKLVSEQLINIKESKEKYFIELVGWDNAPEMEFE